MVEGEIAREKRLPYPEVHSQAGILIARAKEVLKSLPEFRDAASEVFWYGGDNVSFVDKKDSYPVYVTYYGPKINGLGKLRSDEYIHIRKASREGETDVSLAMGFDEEKNRAIGLKLAQGNRDEAPSTSMIIYEGPQVRDAGGFIRKVRDTQQAVKKARKFIESLK